jgi:hypothetical protein
MRTLASPPSAAVGILPLCGLARASRRPTVWTLTLDAILAKRLRVFLASDGHDGMMMHRILVVPGELEALLSAKCLAPAEGDAGDQTISTLAAADYLNTKEVTVIHLMQLKEGLKSRSRGKNRRRPLRVSVEDFASKYMLGGEVCAALA